MRGNSNVKQVDCLVIVCKVELGYLLSDGVEEPMVHCEQKTVSEVGQIIVDTYRIISHALLTL